MCDMAEEEFAEYLLWVRAATEARQPEKATAARPLEPVNIAAIVAPIAP